MPSYDPISLLKQDHERVRELLSLLERHDDPTELLEELAGTIKAHTLLEEEIVYPAFRDAAADSEHEHLYFESLEEHGLVSGVLAELEAEELEPPVLMAKIKVAKDLVVHHLDEEEGQLFPLMRTLCSAEQLSELGQDIAERQGEQPRAQQAGGGGQQTGRVDINRADVEALREIKGIDEVRASRIIAYREAHGPFDDWDDLYEIEGIDDGLVSAIRDQASLVH
jgi:competence ComEA-like helix-hairpin-helix protein